MAKENKPNSELPPPLPNSELLVEMVDTQVFPVEEYSQSESTPDWLFAAAKHKHKWVVGQYISLADYQAAIEATKNEAVR